MTNTHAEIENKFNAKQDNAASLQKQQDEYRRKLELITSIAQRIDNENRQLRKENRELKSEYKAQVNDRELLVKNLVLKKKENEKVREEIAEMENTIEAHKREEESEVVDLDKLDNSLKSTANFKARLGGVNSAMGGTTEGRAPTAASKFGGAAQWNAGTSFLNRPSMHSQQSGPIVYQAKAKVETEEDKIRRYERVIEKLRKMMEHERKQLKNARVQYNKEMH